MKIYVFRIIAIIVFLILLWFCAIVIDYYRATQRQRPLFTYRTVYQLDGGTRIFSGLGYNIIFYNQTMRENGRTDTVFQFLRWERRFPSVEEE